MSKGCREDVLRIILILDVLLVVTNIIGWVITLLYYYYVYTLGVNPPLCYAKIGELVVNCAKVARAPESKILNIRIDNHVISIPVALIAVVWFTTKAILSIYYILGWRRVLDAILYLSGLGLALIPYLIWIELFEVHALCTYCTFLQIFIAVTFIVALELKLMYRRVS